MFALLHLDLITTSDELLVKGDIGQPSWATLGDSLERVECSSDDISKEVDSTFAYTYSALYGSFDEPLWWLIHDFPGSFG